MITQPKKRMIILACLISLVGFVLGQTNVTNSTNPTCFNTCDYNQACMNDGNGVQCHIYIDLCGKRYEVPLSNVTYKTPGNHYYEWIMDHCPLDNVKFCNLFFCFCLLFIRWKFAILLCVGKKKQHPNTNTHAHKYSAQKVNGPGSIISDVNP